MSPRRFRLPRAAATLLSCALLPLGAQAADQADQLAQQLITLRAEVESLNAELAIVREENRTAMAGLSAQKAELEASLARQQLTLRQVRDNLNERETAAADAGVASDVLQPILLSAIDRLDGFIAGGLPFKQEERRAGLKELRDQIETGKLPASRAANRLWAFLEDEFRLTRDNAIQRQTIHLDGETMLADVAKLGTVMMFFRTDDQRVGTVRRAGGDWQFAVASDEASADRIRGLFDALDKQIRQGFFELPNALLVGTGGAR
ncbi:MAG: DUF3450 family protein [Xanthomonadales bacterium]|nr:DUF3450 family protein [Xanthomonadales bacterium]